MDAMLEVGLVSVAFFCFFIAISFFTGVSVRMRVLPDLFEAGLFLGGARVNGRMSLGVTVKPTGDVGLLTSGDRMFTICGTCAAGANTGKLIGEMVSTALMSACCGGKSTELRGCGSEFCSDITGDPTVQLDVSTACDGRPMLDASVVFESDCSSAVGSGRSVTWAGKNASAGNMFRSCGYIPVALNPDTILSGVMAFG